MTLDIGALVSTFFFAAMLGSAAWLAWRGRFWWPVLLAAAAVLAIRLPQSPVPIFNIDEAINAAIAVRLQEGQFLYGGAWDHKPPLSFYLYKLIFDLFGPWNMTAVHAVGGILYAGVVVLTGLVGRRLLPRRVAPWPALLLAPYGLLYYRYDFMAMNHELGGLPFLLLCVLLLWRGLDHPAAATGDGIPGHRRYRRWIWLATAGTAGMIGGLFREACAMVLPVSGLFLLLRAWLREEDSWRTAIKDAAALVLGACLPLAIFVLWILHHGVARDTWYLMITHNLRYRAAGRHGLDWGLHALMTLRSFILYAPALWIPMVAGFVVLAVRIVRMLLRRAPAEPRTVYIGLWCLGAGYMVGQGGRFHGHYFVPFYPPIMIAAAWFLGSLRWPPRWSARSPEAVRRPAGRRGDRSPARAAVAAGASRDGEATAGPRFAVPLGTALLGAVVLLSLIPYYRYQGHNHSRCVQRFILKEDVGAGFKDIMIHREHLAVAKAMGALAGPDEPVFVWGFCPQLYVLAKRRPATRFTFTAILTGQTVEGRMIRTEPRSWELLREDIETERPALVIDASSLFLKDQPLEKYPEFRAWLMERYRPVVEIQGCRFYERNDRKPAELYP